MKFDMVNPDHDEDGPSPGARSPEGPPDPAAEPPLPPPDVRIRQASEYMRLRARTDFERVRSALNQMRHTVEVAQAGAGPAAGSGAPDEPELFRPESFRSRTRTAPRPVPHDQ